MWLQIDFEYLVLNLDDESLGTADKITPLQRFKKIDRLDGGENGEEASKG